MKLKIGSAFGILLSGTFILVFIVELLLELSLNNYSYVFIRNVEKMAQHTLNVLRCEQRNVFKVYLAIFTMSERVN